MTVDGVSYTARILDPDAENAYQKRDDDLERRVAKGVEKKRFVKVVASFIPNLMIRR